MPDPDTIFIWLRIAALALVLLLIVIIIVVAIVGGVLAVRQRSRSYTAFVGQRGPLTDEQRQRLGEAWARVQTDPEFRLRA